LPYDDDAFDTVIGAGVFEQVPFDDDTIREHWCIIKVDGHLFLTYLPNAFSYTEAISRWLGKSHHKKRFTIDGINSYLLHNGFVPEMSAFHQMMPTQLGGFSLKNNKVV
jgi:hypothetical protein